MARANDRAGDRTHEYDSEGGFIFSKPLKIGDSPVYKIRVTREEDGKIVQVKTTGVRNYRQALKRRDKIKKHFLTPSHNMTVNEVAEKFFAGAGYNKKRSAYRREFERLWNREIDGAIGGRLISGILPMDLELVIFGGSEHSDSIYMQHKRRSVLRSFFTFAKRNRFCTTNPASDIELSKIEEAEGKWCLTEEEAQGLVALAQHTSFTKTVSGLRQGGKHSVWQQRFTLPATLRLALILGIQQGLRPRNLLTLTWEHVKFANDQPDHLVIPRELMKANRTFITPLHRDCVLALNERLRQQGKYDPHARVLDDCPRDGANFRDLLRRIGTTYSKDLSDPKRVKLLCRLSPRILRYSFATQLEAKVPPFAISLLMGHQPRTKFGVSGSYITQNSLDVKVREALDRLPSVLTRKVKSKGIIDADE